MGFRGTPGRGEQRCVHTVVHHGQAFWCDTKVVADVLLGVLAHGDDVSEFFGNANSACAKTNANAESVTAFPNLVRGAGQFYDHR